MSTVAGDVRCSWVPDAPVDLHPGTKNVGSGRHGGAAAGVSRETGSASRQPERPTLP